MSHYQRNDRDRGGDYDDRGAPSRSGNGGDHGFNRGGQGRGDPSRGARPLGGGHYGSSGPNQGPSGDMNAGPPPRDGGYNDSRGSAGYSNQRDASGGYNEGGSSYNNDRAVGGGGGRYNDARGSYMDDRGAATGGGHYNSSRDVWYNDVGGYGNDFHRGRVVDRGYDDRIRTNDGGQYSGAGAGRGGGYDNRESQRYGDVGSAAGGHNDGRGGGSTYDDRGRDFDRQDNRGFHRDRQYDDSRGVRYDDVPQRRDYDSRSVGMPPQRDYDSRGGDIPPRKDLDSGGGGASMPPQRDFDSRGAGMPHRDSDSRNGGGVPPQRDFHARGGGVGMPPQRARGHQHGGRAQNYNNGSGKQGPYGSSGGKRDQNYNARGQGGNRSGGRGEFPGGRGAGNNTKTKILTKATEANCNILKANITNNFRFYHYGIDGVSKNGSKIDSRGRKSGLFHFGLFDLKDGLLARNGMSPEAIADMRRVVFFEGSFAYASRPIPFINKFPMSLVGTKVPEDNAPLSDNGDTITVTQCLSYSAPELLLADQVKSGADGIAVDLRCSECTKAFKSKDAVLDHCKRTGHKPEMDLDEPSKHASIELFIGFCNVALQRAMSERMAKWGREYIDPKNWTEPTDRNGRSMGVRIFRAFSCEFGIHKLSDKNVLTLTVDLRAKIIRRKSLLDNLCNDRDPKTVRFDRRDRAEALRRYEGEIVICTYDKKCYDVIGLDFENSPASLPVQGTGMSHADYFRERKGIELRYPDFAPIVVLLGRNKKKIFLPAELVCANDLDPIVRSKLPMIASFRPPDRHEAIEEMRKYLVPGAQKTKGAGGGLLPALGIIIDDARVIVPVEILPLPILTTAGIKVPIERARMWAPVISRANWDVERGTAVEMKVVVIHHESLRDHAEAVYGKIRDCVNKHNSFYRFAQQPLNLIPTGDDKSHCRAVQDYFSQKLPDNIFVVDMVKPPRRQALDTAYSVVKYLLTKNGYISQFLNFNTHDHAFSRDDKASHKSSTIMQGVARQILSKCGARVWWVNLPREVPLPAVFVGVDVFHAPRKYSVDAGKRVARASVAAVVVQVIRSHDERDNTHTDTFSQTFRREGGQEMGLGDSIQTCVANALRIFDVHPMSCVVWRDGVSDTAIKQVMDEEVPSIRKALTRGNDQSASVPLSYLVVQKRISTKFLSVDGSSALPLGALVTTLQGPEYSTFYIMGTSPPYSTPKPARFIIAKMDDDLPLSKQKIAELSWALCHDYSNWTGAIKLPSPVQCAHKLAEFAGQMENGGEEIAHEKFAGKPYFL